MSRSPSRYRQEIALQDQKPVSPPQNYCRGTAVTINGDGKFAQATALTGRMYVIVLIIRGLAFVMPFLLAIQLLATMSKKVVNLRFCVYWCVQEGQPIKLGEAGQFTLATGDTPIQ